MRVAIIGNSGSGKTSLAKQLAHGSGAEVLDLDTLAWVAGEIAVPRPPELAIADLRGFCAGHASWIVEGCYASLIAAALEFRPTLLLLDPGLEQCLANCLARPWEPHKYPSKEEQDQRLAFLLDWVRDYEQRGGDLSRVGHEALYAGYDGPKQWLRAIPDADFCLPVSA